MEEVTFTRRTIEVPKGEEKVNLKWTEKGRIPRKLKKKLKKRFGTLWRMPIIVKPILDYRNKRTLLSFLNERQYGK